MFTTIYETQTCDWPSFSRFTRKSIQLHDSIVVSSTSDSNTYIRIYKSHVSVFVWYTTSVLNLWIRRDIKIRNIAWYNYVNLNQNRNLLWRQGLKCIKAARLRARRETRRSSIFCSRLHRFQLVWEEFRKASAVAESGIWLLTSLHISSFKICHCFLELLLAAAANLAAQ